MSQVSEGAKHKRLIFLEEEKVVTEPKGSSEVQRLNPFDDFKKRKSTDIQD
jgi:hypothetical protein